MAGTITSIVAAAILVIGGLSKQPDTILPMRIDGCTFNFTIPMEILPSNESEFNEDIPWVFRISFMYYATIGFAIVYLIGYPVSLLTGGNKLYDQRLLAIFLRKQPIKQIPSNHLEEIDLLS